MSGGHFNYDQYKIGMIADDIQLLIDNNHIQNEWGYTTNYSKETIAEFRKAIVLLREAQVYAQRIDWLVSGDDGEDSFHERIKSDLTELGNKE
jgi:hypothetical protein